MPKSDQSSLSTASLCILSLCTMHEHFNSGGLPIFRYFAIISGATNPHAVRENASGTARHRKEATVAADVRAKSRKNVPSIRIRLVERHT